MCFLCNSMYQVVFGSLESVASSEYNIQVRRGCFLYFCQIFSELFSGFLGERYRGISLNRHPGKMPVNLSLLCKNQILSCSLLNKYVITWKYLIFSEIIYLLKQPFCFWVWFWGSVTISESLTVLAIQNKVNQNVTLFCSPSAAPRASSIMAKPKFLILECCMLL